MARDPYGYPPSTPPPAVSEAPSPAGTVLALGVSAVSALVCLGFGGFAVLLGVVAEDEPRLVDRIGIAVLASMCAWPAGGIAVWSLGLRLVSRTPWLQVGPNLLIGAVTGFGLWFLVCGGLAAYAGITEPH